MKIKGYASVFNTKDYSSDIILPCSFTKTIKNKNIDILYEHNFNNIIGKITNIYENEIGLFIEGEINKSNVNIQNYTINNIINGLSIGYIAKNFYYQNNTRIITELNLLEISLVKHPANKHCKITYSKF